MAEALSTRQFQRIAHLAHEMWGLSLPEQKRQMVATRLGRFLKRSRFTTLNEVLKQLEEGASPEDQLAFFDMLSTNTTRFFRDVSHFAFLEREFFTPLARGTATVPQRKIRIWSSACSTGCEPYSIAMTALESMPDLDRWDLKILATDLSSSALESARAGEYPADHAEDLSPERRKRFFEMRDERAIVRKEVRDLISFRRLNLNAPWPFAGPFQIIFCCNVMIYFDEPTRKALVHRFYDMLTPGGVLAVGSAETLAGLGTRFKAVQANVYRK